MRLTRRGKALVAVCVGGFVLAALFGARALNAVVLPGVVALAAGALQIRSLDPPTVDRDVPGDDFVGSTHEVTLRFRDVGRPFVGTVTDEVSEGLTSEQRETTTTVGDGPVTYSVTYETRGEHRLGPARVVGRDVFGLFERELRCSGDDSFLAYPTVYGVAGGVRRDLLALHETDSADERAEFDNLREYVRGDALRDVHWKSSAKRDDLVVQEFTADRDLVDVTIAGGTTAAGADRLAEAVASLAAALNDADVPVALALPNGRVEADADRVGRTRLLEHCARVVDGPVPTDEADVVVEARDSSVEIRLRDRRLTFDDVQGRETLSATADGPPRGTTA
ncbi:Uncharacterized conserved protein, DUF58 family, contains vWF domain [Halogranum amylolyticum]|uniref:Uncharacterized conserved protein, DUF58 family, contains vWF domain n=1 Tax=Halogranum amylolyticum TaxID=660520 RepID=A0A1H8TRT1_9EURY|nr:DUF58 domain-containing protein [Halogranum amylolyticum]SEO93607.1 Uncharacterized conserved protein, DUF58 family, contains vWF domain [Halogranum amylolyticum]